MRLHAHFFAIALYAFSLTSHAQNALSVITPSPLTIALTVGQWLIKDSQKVYFVKVESTASTPAQAREEGFRLAVRQAVGALVVAETEVKNQQLVRNDIIQYSSGYVQDFKILSESQVGSMSRVVMDVWVSDSKIANRLLNVSKDDGSIDGEKSAVQFKSNLNQIESGDQLLRLVLNDFPAKAFDIKVGKSAVSMPGRGLQIQIPVNISWNKEYIASLTEVLATIRQGRSANYFSGPNWGSVIRFKNKTDWSMSIASFKDRVRLELLESSLIHSRPMIRLAIKNESGRSLYRQCFNYTGLSGAYLGESVPIIGYVRERYGYTAGQFFSYGGEFGERSNLKPADFSIFGDFKDDVTLTVNFPPQIALEQLGNMNRVEVTVVRKETCDDEDESLSSRPEVISWCRTNPGNGKKYCPQETR